MLKFTYKQLLEVRDGLKTNPNDSISTWDHNNGIINQLHVIEVHFEVILAAAKRFKTKRERIGKKGLKGILLKLSFMR